MKNIKKNDLDSFCNMSEKENFIDCDRPQEDRSFFKEHFDMIFIIFGVFIIICAICVTVSIVDANKTEIRYLNDRIRYLEQKMYEE